jgi:hypothetical protein
MDDTHSSGKLTASSQFFRAHDGRAVFLRGVNLSSSVKQPRGLPSHVSDKFFDHGEVVMLDFRFPL